MIIASENTDVRLIDLLCDQLTVLWEDWPRNMNLTTHNVQHNEFTLSGECPHCRHNTVFKSLSVNQVNLEKERHLLLVSPMLCPGCSKFILAIVAKLERELVYQRHYPLGEPDDSVAEEVPKNIADDFREALRCRWVKAYKATGVMCGRALEASCIDLGANANKIGDRIDELVKLGKITGPLRDMADMIKHGRNRGAHPPEDPINEVLNAPEADALILFMREFFHHVYVLPAKVKALNLSRSARPKL